MSTRVEWWAVNLPVDQAYQNLLRFLGTLKTKDITARVVERSEPSYIKAEIKVSWGGARGTVESRISSMDEKSRIQFVFDFKEHVYKGTIAGILVLTFFLVLSFLSGGGIGFAGAAIITSGIFIQLGLTAEKAAGIFMDKANSFFGATGFTFYRVAGKISTSETPEEIYKRLRSLYDSFWGRTTGGRELEMKINTYVDQGLTREEAILRVAMDEGILE